MAARSRLEDLLGRAAAPPFRVTVVELAGAELVDCSALAVLTAAQRRARAAGAGFQLAGVPARVRRILSLSDAGRGLLAAGDAPALERGRLLDTAESIGELVDAIDWGHVDAGAPVRAVLWAALEACELLAVDPAAGADLWPPLVAALAAVPAAPERGTHTG